MYQYAHLMHASQVSCVIGALNQISPSILSLTTICQRRSTDWPLTGLRGFSGVVRGSFSLIHAARAEVLLCAPTASRTCPSRWAWANSSSSRSASAKIAHPGPPYAVFPCFSLSSYVFALVRGSRAFNSFVLAVSMSRRRDSRHRCQEAPAYPARAQAPQ